MTEVESTLSEQGQCALTTLPGLSLLRFFGWCLGRFKRVRVVGESMQPTLSPGDEVLVRRCSRLRRVYPQPGQLLWLQHPLRSDIQLIKRCERVMGSRVFVQGDNASESTDSRQFGPVSFDLILGCVVCTFP